MHRPFQTSSEGKYEADSAAYANAHALQPVNDDVHETSPQSSQLGQARRGHQDSGRPTPRRRNLLLGGSQPPSHRRPPHDQDDEDENIHDILLERKLSYRRRQQKRLRRRSVQNGQGKGGAVGGAVSGVEPLLHDVMDEEVEAGSAVRSPNACCGGSFVTIPLTTSPESMVEECERAMVVQSAKTSPVSPEVKPVFNVTRSADHYSCFHSNSDSFDSPCVVGPLHKTASSRRRAFQQSAAGSGRNRLSITVHRSSMSDGEPPSSPHSAGEDALSCSPCPHSPLRHDRLTSPDDRRAMTSSPDDLCSGLASSRTPSPSSSRKAAGRRNGSPSPATGKRMHKSDSLSPGNKRKVHNKGGRASPGDSRRSPSGAAPGPRRAAAPSSEPSTPTGWSKDQHFRLSLSPSSSRRARGRAEAGSPGPVFGKTPERERRRCGDGAVKDQGMVDVAPKLPRARGSSLEACSDANKLRERSYSEGNEREGDGVFRHEYSPRPPRHCASQTSILAGAGPPPPSRKKSSSPQRSSRTRARDILRSQSSTTVCTHHSHPAHSPRRLNSTDRDVTQGEPRDPVITCRCLWAEGRMGRSCSPSMSGRGEGGRTSSPRDLLKVYEQDMWNESDSQLVHTVLHKAPDSSPGEFSFFLPLCTGSDNKEEDGNNFVVVVVIVVYTVKPVSDGCCGCDGCVVAR